jgi:RNA 2',3'-cyclic 3'-phosphodiesterase
MAMRLFIGVGISAEARAALAKAAEQARLCTDARWVPVEQYHVTLAFLGECGGDALPALESLLWETAAGVSPFLLTLYGFGSFGREDDAILYAALQNQPALLSLSDAVRLRLAGAGQAFDPKPFAPHVTLARKARLTPGEALPAFSPVTFPVDALTLYHSSRAEGVLRYIPVIRTPLGALRGATD